MSNGENDFGEPNVNLMQVQTIEDNLNLALEGLAKIRKTPKSEDVKSMAVCCSDLLTHVQSNALQHLRILCE